MRRLGLLIYIGLLLSGLYFAYQWSSARLPKRVKLTTFELNSIHTMQIRRGGVELTLKIDPSDSSRWVFSTNLDSVRAYSLESALVVNVLESLRSAKYAFLVEQLASQSLQRYGLGQQERYEIDLWYDKAAQPIRFELGALTVNGYDIFILHKGNVYRASFVGIYERLEALGKVVDVILGVEDRLFA